MTPPGRAPKSMPVRAMRIALPSRSQEEELVGVLERPAIQREVETLVLKPPRAGVEGAMEEESALRAPAVEVTRIPEPARAGDEGAVAATMERAAPEDAVSLVELPQSGEEYGDSGDINPAAAANAADQVFEFVAASEEVLGTQMYEELGSDDNWVIVQSGAPSDIARTKQGGGGDDWRAYTIPSDFADAEQEEGDA